MTGSRPLLALCIALGVGALTAVVVFTGLVYVGPDSTLGTVLASGMLGALATVVTVTLSINQLILSRVFGTPADLTDRLEGNLEFRQTIEDVADIDTSPNDPGSFLALLAGTLEERAAALERAVDDADLDDDLDDRVDDLTSELVEYAHHLGEAEGSESTFEVLLLTFGTEYADRIDDVRRLRRTTDERLPDAATDHVDAILELLKGVAVIRQFFKTLAIQQDLASLSRQLIYTGITGLLVTYYLAQVYTPSGMAPTIAAPWLPWVVVGASMVVFAPVAVLVSTLLRVATVTLYTVSVGSFIPPEERIGRS
ncbi:MAG: hypothetical protein ABEJ05_10755 [Haloglomus sp.]